MGDIKRTDLGISFNENPVKVDISGEADPITFDVAPEFLDDFEIAQDDPLYTIILEEEPVITSDIYDEIKVQKQAEEFLSSIATFMVGLGRIENINLVDMRAYDVDEGHIENGHVKFTIRLVNDNFNRTVVAEINIPIYKGEFHKPMTFKSGSKIYELSPEGVKQAFNFSLEEHRKRRFPDYRQSRRWPLVLQKFIDDE